MNDRQRAFADYYIECGNATEAAKKAGYSPKTAYSIGNENLKKPEILDYIQSRTASAKQKRIASGDEVLQFFTRVMEGVECSAKMQDRISAGREILKRDVDTRRLEIEMLKLELKQPYSDSQQELDDSMLEALNSTAAEVWGEISNNEYEREKEKHRDESNGFLQESGQGGI